MFKSRIATLSILLFFVWKATGQGIKSSNNDPETIYDYEVVDWKPQFPGGDWQFVKFFNENMQMPPVTNELRQITKIWTRFVVEKDGSLTGLEFPQHTLLDKQVREFFAKMPKWETGMHKGKTVRVLYNFPILVHIE
jgi:periplasmic protein TonB